MWDVVNYVNRSRLTTVLKYFISFPLTQQNKPCRYLSSHVMIQNIILYGKLSNKLVKKLVKFTTEFSTKFSKFLISSV